MAFLRSAAPISAAACFALISAAGCQAILGIDDTTFTPGGDASPEGDGGPSGDGSFGDGSPSDASGDSGTDATAPSILSFSPSRLFLRQGGTADIGVTLARGTFDASLAALERMSWFSSSEPRDLYALYVRRGLRARAVAFRAALRTSAPFPMDEYLDQVDRDPGTDAP